jgi:hypothetical protein
MIWPPVARVKVESDIVTSFMIHFWWLSDISGKKKRKVKEEQGLQAFM